MCGIFALINVYQFSYKRDEMNLLFKKGEKRGPDHSILDYFNDYSVFGFHRLAINGLNDTSNQPFFIQGIYLICNGEIFNYKYLYKFVETKPVTNSDCEIIIYLYLKFGIENMLNMLDGEFSFVLLDTNNQKMFIARDPFGVRPLYFYEYSEYVFAFASEIKMLNDLNTILRKLSNKYEPLNGSIQHFQPGTVSTYYRELFSFTTKDNEKVYRPHFQFQSNQKYHCLSPIYHYFEFTENQIYKKISSFVNLAVLKRCLTTERPIACLLSGGLDSSLITALTCNYYKKNNISYPLETYSIGLEGSTDLKYARIVADYLQTNHTEIIVTEKEMFDAIPEVIYAIESYDTTTVRASIGNYLVAKYISQHSEAKVILNGDGSDELFGGYLYMNQCPSNNEFDNETHRLLSNIHYYDVLRSDKCISSNGLEARTPFLDKTLVNYVLSLDIELRNHNNVPDRIEKYLLRKSFELEHFDTHNHQSLLPDEILWRRKEAFSDGVTSTDRSLFQILQEQIGIVLKENEPNVETEKKYYRQLFQQYFDKAENIIPEYWMPKYIESSNNDPSARTLSCYK
jgi:asparagine synthase (glutamine-hydrolysing)